MKPYSGSNASGRPGRSPVEPIVPDRDLMAIAEDVDRVLAQPSAWLRFPPRLERVFEAELGDERARLLIWAGLVALLSYDLFLIADYSLLSDIFPQAAAFRLGVVTPLGLLVVVALWRGVSAAIRETLESAIVFVSAASLVVFAYLSQAPDSIYYRSGLNSGLLLVVAYGNIVVRLRFPYALATSLAIVVFTAAFTPTVSQLPLILHVNNLLGLVTAAVFTLIANYVIERDQRRSYLLGLRERIRRAALVIDNAKLVELSHVDSLTGVANRRGLEEHLRLLRIAHASDDYAVMMFDIDHFKGYNDHYGHLAGDTCLRKVAEALRAGLHRSGDLAARFGGEEFVVVLTGVDHAAAEQVANRLCQRVAELRIPHAASPIADVVTISAGVALATFGAEQDALDVFSAADQALYRAKSSGRNRASL